MVKRNSVVKLSGQKLSPDGFKSKIKTKKFKLKIGEKEILSKVIGDMWDDILRNKSITSDERIQLRELYLRMEKK